MIWTLYDWLGKFFYYFYMIAIVSIDPAHGTVGTLYKLAYKLVLYMALPLLQQLFKPFVRKEKDGGLQLS